MPRPRPPPARTRKLRLMRLPPLSQHSCWREDATDFGGVHRKVMICSRTKIKSATTCTACLMSCDDTMSFLARYSNETPSYSKAFPLFFLTLAASPLSYTYVYIYAGENKDRNRTEYIFCEGLRRKLTLLCSLLSTSFVFSSNVSLSFWSTCVVRCLDQNLLPKVAIFKSPIKSGGEPFKNKTKRIIIWWWEEKHRKNIIYM